MEQSRRSDSVESFVNSLLVFYNCQLGKDDNGNDITPQMIRAAGAIFLKSIGQDKADLKEINSVLDQSQTQIFIETPYRNNRLIAELCKSLPGNIKLCIASDITGEKQSIITLPLSKWAKAQYNYDKIPTIFLLYK